MDEPSIEALVGGGDGEPLADDVRRQVEELSAASLQGNVIYLGAELAKPWTRAWLARLEGRLAGFLVAWHVADELHVLGVAVDAAARRRGLGRRLVREACGYAGSHAIRLVLLEVRRGNAAAIGLYRGFGFSAMGLRPGYYADGEDALEMMLSLDPATGEVIPTEDELHL